MKRGPSSPRQVPLSQNHFVDSKGPLRLLPLPQLPLPSDSIAPHSFPHSMKEQKRPGGPWRQPLGSGERRHNQDRESPAELAARAARKALSLTQTASSELDLILYCGVTREFLEPATAAKVQDLLSASGAISLDLSNACLGFVDGLLMADTWIAAGRVKKVLVVSAELGTDYALRGARAIGEGQDPKLLLSSLTLGDGAAAALVVPKKAPDLGICYALRESYGEHFRLCVIKKAGGLMFTHPSELITHALERTPALVQEVLTQVGWQRESIARVVSHQITERHLYAGGRAGGFPKDKMEITVDRYGNMGSVSVPYTLAQALAEGRIHSQDRILIAGFGSGLGMSMIALRIGTTLATYE
jgi:3-oxoacyl-[acyl-carrier-protein] synthase-3